MKAPHQLIRYALVPKLFLSALLFVLCLAAYAVLHVFWFAPTRSHEAALRVAVRSAQAELVDYRNRTGIAETYKQRLAELGLLEQRLNQTRSQAQLVAATNVLVGRSQIFVRHAENRLEVESSGYSRFYQELSIEGGYSQIRYFLYNLQRGENAIVVDTIEWQETGQADQQTLRIEFYALMRSGS